jgi:serine/threonine-protein kinase
MVAVPAGTFLMGSTIEEVDDAIALCRAHYSTCNRWYYMRENPEHSVSLDGFWLDETEITNGQYRRCVEAGVCLEPSGCKKGEPTYGDPERREHPVVCVSWTDAQTYCGWAGGRLPTEAEWEYAYRGAGGSIFPWGAEFDGSRLNYCDANCSQPHADDRFDDGYVDTAPVGSHPQGASWCGVLGLGGNVAEWVADWQGEYSPGEYSPDSVSNPAGPETGDEKMLKGGSWFGHPTYCRGAARPSLDPETRFDFVGFRCAASEGQEPG